ncbi:hypothetical protein [Amycolatopsis lexingtonensis]|uniref:hypothetical protein n=1 Tax=Amycolatopsis lexingtonensis TaxID=218822 RepID=UPI003F726D3A
MSAPKSEREAYVTGLVVSWIENDQHMLDRARWLMGDAEAMVAWLRLVVKTARRDRETTAAAWHVRQELAPRDYDRVDWSEVVQAVRSAEA